MMQHTAQRSPYQMPEGEKPRQKMTIYHIYREEIPEDQAPTIEAENDPKSGQNALSQPTPPFTLFCFFCVGLLCIAIPSLATFIGQAYPNTYGTTISQTITLTLALHPAKGELPLYALPKVNVWQQASVTATGSIHQDATKATGLLTFFNGAFTTQTVPAGTMLRGKDGVAVVTSQTAVLPAATPTTPPTYGTVSVIAVSSVVGAEGNIPASDIDQACCGTSVLAQNLSAFSGGQDAREIPMLTKADLATGTQQVTGQVNEAVNGQAQKEAKPGYILLPLDCSRALAANHQAGDQAASAIITLSETCIPFVYFAPDIATLAQRRVTIPQGYQLVSFSAFVVANHLTAKGGTLTIQTIAYLKRNRAVASAYRFIGR